MTVDADAAVADVIDRFQAHNQELALVIDGDADGNATNGAVPDDGAVVGLVTATDAFEEITAQLKDPLDHELPAA